MLVSEWLGGSPNVSRGSLLGGQGGFWYGCTTGWVAHPVSPVGAAKVVCLTWLEGVCQFDAVTDDTVLSWEGPGQVSCSFFLSWG